MKSDDLELVSVDEVTTRGNLLLSYPKQSGNSFVAKLSDGTHRRVLRLNHENYEELVRRGIFAEGGGLRLKVSATREDHVEVNDSRVPADWITSTCKDPS